MSDALERAVAKLDPVSLADLEARATLLRRVDNKYLVDPEQFVELAARLGEDHQVLEIDNRRAFGYESVYFDTSDLRCFSDHVDGRVPRFKARTRYYRDSDHCVFEVKLKRTEDEMDKRQLDYRPDDRDRVTSAAAGCLEEALDDIDLELHEPLDTSLRTSFSRATLAAREGAERLTCDVDVRLRAPDGSAVGLRGDLVLLEAKSEEGDSPADRVLADMGVDPVSLSKYRVGIALVGDVDAREQPGQRFFT